MTAGRKLPTLRREAGEERRTTPRRPGSRTTATWGTRGLSRVGPTPGIRPTFWRIVSNWGGSTPRLLHEGDFVDFSQGGVPIQGPRHRHVAHEHHAVFPGRLLDLRRGAP